MSKTLILLTQSFPYIKGESFLEDELRFHYKSFDNIYIITQVPIKEHDYVFPDHVKCISNVVRFNLFSKIKAIFFINFKVFFAEKRFVNYNLNSSFTFRKKKIFLIEYWKAVKFSQPVSKIIHHEISNNNSVIIYSYWNDYKAMAAALLKSKYPTLKAISRSHRWDVYFEVNPEKYLPGKSLICKNLDAIYYVSKDGYNYSLNLFGKLPNLKISRLGTSNNYNFDEETTILNKIINKAKNRKQCLNILSCSYFLENKRLDYIPQALSLITDTIIHWCHIGGHEGDQAVRNYVQILSTSLLDVNKCKVKHTFLGYFNSQKITEFYKHKNIHILINTSKTEGIPVTMMEAMSFCIPVIGTDVGGVSEIIKNNYNGILLSANPSYREIADAILFFYNMPESDYEQFCFNAYTTWEQNYNADKNYKDFINSISSL